MFTANSYLTIRVEISIVILKNRKCSKQIDESLQNQISFNLKTPKNLRNIQDKSLVFYFKKTCRLEKLILFYLFIFTCFPCKKRSKFQWRFFWIEFSIVATLALLHKVKMVLGMEWTRFKFRSFWGDYRGSKFEDEPKVREVQSSV